VETHLKFTEFQTQIRKDLQKSLQCLSEKGMAEKNPERLPALILAYIGDAVFSLHVRSAMLAVEANRVQVLHTLLARMASAPLQAQALNLLETSLTETEKAMIRRGRNAKGRVPRNSSIAEYRASTALEALLGYLYLSQQTERLQQILQQIISSMCQLLMMENEEGAVR
jgi:ribonuclease III family protein